jgi:hypothetical protein
VVIFTPLPLNPLGNSPLYASYRALDRAQVVVRSNYMLHFGSHIDQNVYVLMKFHRDVSPRMLLSFNFLSHGFVNY